MSISWHPADALVAAARAQFADAGVLLDIGCGIQPQTLVAPRVHVCCEPFPEYASHLQRAANDGKVRADVVLNLSWADALRVLPEKSVDSVFLLDVIEHLEKDDGARLLAETERIARRQIVIFTPLGFMPQPHTGTRDAWGLGGGDVQQHRSGWTPDDFDSTWDIVASRDFHRVDSLGQVLAQPFGAFYAIKHLSVDDGVASRDRDLRALTAEASAIQNPAVLAEALRLVRSARRVYRPAMLAPSRVAIDLILALCDSWLGRLAHRSLLLFQRRP